MLVGEVDLLADSCLYVELVVAEVGVVNAVAHPHDRLLHYPLANYQLPEVNDVLQLLNDLLEPHRLQVLIQLHVLDHQCESHSFACPQHQMLDQVEDLPRLFRSQELDVD